MALFLDVHTFEGGITIDDVVRARLADLRIQPGYRVRYLRYWVCEASGKVFCLVEAPSAIAAATVHLEAHGLVAQQVFTVQPMHDHIAS
ncbi:MAG: DUF4242 domain-containing protein [Actinobacteria bacterium]|nr:DUF4242 domain-containing protein [Actinomycetota bacterium]